MTAYNNIVNICYKSGNSALSGSYNFVW